MTTPTPATVKAALTAIARTEAGLPTLAFRRRDALDFHDLSVGSVRRLLLAAYRLGREHGAAGAADVFAPIEEEGGDLWEDRTAPPPR